MQETGKDIVFVMEGETDVHNETRTGLGSDSQRSIWKRDIGRLPYGKQSSIS